MRYSPDQVKEISLQKLYPEVAKEWHPTKNGELTPDSVSFGSQKKAWWKCAKGHEWLARIGSRTDKRITTKCPYCGRKKAGDDNSLAFVRPDVAKDWHPTKNGTLTPKDVVPGSAKMVWWQCAKGHEWSTSISTQSRKEGVGCPRCSRLKADGVNSLAVRHPEVAKEWHPTKNGKLTPYDVVRASHQKVWWICSKGHEWDARISSRTDRNIRANCPYCSGHKAGEDNCLATLFPKIAKEWHPTKNGALTPKDVVPGSLKKVWWRCSRRHSWQSVVFARAIKGKGCPVCSRNRALKKIYRSAGILIGAVNILSSFLPDNLPNFF